MDRLLRMQVWQRSGSRCEYCQLPQEFTDAGHEIDHIIAEKHRGATELENLALACFHCNNHKGPNIAGIDPATGHVARIFHPRQDRWDDHFSWHGAVLMGLTPIGRATVEVLAINIRHRVMHRQALIDEGVFP
ncbi:MAG TPA: HNH endonuclease [Pirellulales bacterium]|nr:HNH endonuclease [Pirellulales bacterium]